MATIKSFTDLPQSKVLAEILPLESADMYYWLAWRGDTSEEVRNTPKVGKPRKDAIKTYWCPCWSLASLLEIIKKLVGYSLQSLDTHTVFMNCELGDKPYNIETKNYDNPIDACYEMIIRLNELKML